MLVYDAERIREQVRRGNTALVQSGQPHRLYFALKANRFAPVVQVIRDTGLCGIDASSPGEVQFALEAGFDASQISFTGASLSADDVRAIAAIPMRLNVNSISTIHKLGRSAPGRKIGLRINPQIGVGATAGLVYAGETPTQFGIYPDRVEEALRLARSYDLVVEGVHMHIGSGWLEAGAPTFLRATQKLVALAGRVGESLRYVNIGGGIGVARNAADREVDLDHYGSTVGRLVRESLGPEIEVCAEPGDFLVNDAGVIGARVTEVEEKGGALFVSLDVGFNANPQAAHYGLISEVVHAEQRMTPEKGRTCLVTGNINESIDVFNRNVVLPEVSEGAILALLNAGGYGSSMQSHHCLRALPTEMLLD